MNNDFLFNANSHFSQHRICIIDPVLALSVYGVPLIQQLGEVMELWVVRELWHILDNSNFYLHHPELITPRGIDSSKTPKQERVALEETLWSLKKWEQFRRSNDLGRLNLFWLGDSLKESLLPKNRNLQVFWQWEALTKSLDSQLDQSQTIDYVLPLAFRDTIALAVSLGSAFILTYQQKADFEKKLPPEICKSLEFWGISCQILTPTEPLVSAERDYLQQLLVSTGTLKFLWAGLHLIVLHLFVPEYPKTEILSQKLPPSLSSLAEDKTDKLNIQNHSWVGARGFWYLLPSH